MLTAITSYEASIKAAELAKQRRKNLPTTQWVLKADHSYSCFLSHFKAEVGAEARYLKE
jgi:hypothetical protein